MISDDRYQELFRRLDRLDETVKEHGHPNGQSMGRIEERLRAVQDDVKDLKNNFVRQTEFAPVRMLVYGLVALLLTGVVGGLLGLVILR